MKILLRPRATALGLMTLLGLCHTPQLSAQSEAKPLGIIYKLTTRGNERVKLPEQSGFTILQATPSEAVFADYARYQLDSVNASSEATEQLKREYFERTGKAEKYFEPIITQRQGGDLQVLDAAFPDLFVYSETPLEGWEIGAEERVIAGYTCQRASISYGGREWTVWFTEDLPLPYGPWKLRGLPGLILEAKDAEGLFHFELAALYPSIGFAMHPQPTVRHTPTQRKDFVQRFNDIMADPQRRISTGGLRNLTIFKNPDGTSTILANGGLRFPRHQAGQYIPIEF